MNDDLTDEERSEQVRGALFKALAVVAVIGLLIFIGTTIMVRALNLDEGGGTGPVGAQPGAPTTPLPSTALPSPRQRGAKAGKTSSALPQTGKPGRIELAISPVMASPMERVNLTGSYKGADNVSLEVQRFADGQWTNFGVQAQVNVGTFATYIMTGRSGENRFRVWDPQAHEGSNVILVTID